MQLQTQKRLGMVKADTDDWKDTVRHHIEEGENFLLVLPNNRAAVDDFCRLFGLPINCAPKALTRPGFFRLTQFMEKEAFDQVLVNWTPDSQVVFVEQLDFPVNRPPRLQPFMVYSHVLGILAQASSMKAAKEALEEQQGGWSGGLPEASIYCWKNGRWQLYEGK
jgi:hypothetical protein